MPVLVLEKKKSVDQPFTRLATIVRLVRDPLKVPAWAIVAVALLVGLSCFAAGRVRPAHHYVSYFGYPMVLDTTTGKACYAAPPRPSDSAELQDTSDSQDSSGDALSRTASAGSTIPLCGKE